MLRVLFTAAFCLLPFYAFAGSNEARTARAFDGLKNNPPLLRMFLSQMPKGGDLHNHFDGAIYAENFIRWAMEDGYCIDKMALALVPPPCSTKPSLAPAVELANNSPLYAALVNAMSTRGYDGGASGHDRFFNTFVKFGMFPAHRIGDIFAESARRLAAQNTFYAELMISTGMFDAAKLGSALTWNDDLTAMDKELDMGKIAALVADTRAKLDAAEKRKSEILKCGTTDEDPGCEVTLKYIPEVIRTLPKTQVFAQIAFAAALVKADERAVALNLVAPEDDPVTLRNYAAQMRMVGHVTNKGRDIPVTLHAGELTLGLVPPEDLRNHIRLAVEEAGAKRIGHGVSISYEDDADGLLKKMAVEKIAVEIGLTSNDTILSVKGKDHPFDLYRRYKVPVTLATDDEGVSRSDLTQEYQRAVTSYNLSYADLKQLARNALHYSFMKGENLFQDNIAPVATCAGDLPVLPVASDACTRFLTFSEKARAQFDLERRFTDFEAKVWP